MKNANAPIHTRGPPYSRLSDTHKHTHAYILQILRQLKSPLLTRERDRQTDRQRQTGRERQRQKDGRTYRETQTYRQREGKRKRFDVKAGQCQPVTEGASVPCRVQSVQAPGPGGNTLSPVSECPNVRTRPLDLQCSYMIESSQRHVLFKDLWDMYSCTSFCPDLTLAAMYNLTYPS